MTVQLEDRNRLEELLVKNLRRYFTDVRNGPTAVVNLIVESNTFRRLLARAWSEGHVCCHGCRVKNPYEGAST